MTGFESWVPKMLSQFVRRNLSLLVGLLLILLPTARSVLDDECVQTIDRVEAYFREREKYLDQDIGHLQRQLQHQSFRSAVLKFGRGPHFVEFVLDVPLDRDGGATSERSIIMRLAPLDIMPHTVHTFLEIVSRNLYKGTTFSVALEHLAFVDTKAKDGSRLGKLFVDAGDRDDFTPYASFREYTKDHPHLPWTVGFVGSEHSLAGPEFYISMADNSDLHGPAADGRRAGLPKKIDPCFATVVSGRDVVQYVHSLPSSEGGALIDPVSISSCRILTEEEGRRYNEEFADL